MHRDHANFVEIDFYHGIYFVDQLKKKTITGTVNLLFILTA